jgi:hypothetical protein
MTPPISDLFLPLFEDRRPRSPLPCRPPPPPCPAHTGRCWPSRLPVVTAPSPLFHAVLSGPDHILSSPSRCQLKATEAQRRAPPPFLPFEPTTRAPYRLSSSPACRSSSPATGNPSFTLEFMKAPSPSRLTDELRPCYLFLRDWDVPHPPRRPHTVGRRHHRCRPPKPRRTSSPPSSPSTDPFGEPYRRSPSPVAIPRVGGARNEDRTPQTAAGWLPVSMPPHA